MNWYVLSHYVLFRYCFFFFFLSPFTTSEFVCPWHMEINKASVKKIYAKNAPVGLKTEILQKKKS